jgi:hypothetical protein
MSRHPTIPRPSPARLLTGAQRKGLESRIGAHFRDLHYRIGKEVDKAPEPLSIVRARLTIARWEEQQELKTKTATALLQKQQRQLIQNLLFDTVESCLEQLEEFEETKPEDFL